LNSSKIAILVVAYNAEDTLHKVLDRIPQDFVDKIAVVLVCDDASTDSTHDQAIKYQQNSNLPLNIVRHSQNRGYGGNQKFGYRWSIDNGMDVVVLLHGDGQYAPEEIPRMVAPILADNTDVVFGSRMMQRSKAIKGGMPLYKFIGNIFLTTTQNLLTGVRLSEWHTGYRAYRVSSLRDVSFENNSNYFDFDTQIILQMIGSRQRITEIQIPTFYGDEISRVNTIKYGLQILGHTVRYALKRLRKSA
jgi:glycosyltransferase involved in cell wall biosynthesis